MTVVTVALNALPLLRQTISATASLGVAVEHWVIDGGSSDGTVEWLQGSEQPSGLRWLSEPDSGIYDAMNKGLERATGRYVWFLNAGDVPFGSQVLGALMTSSSPDILYGDTVLVDATGQMRALSMAPQPLNASLMARGMYVSHQSFIVRRELAPRYDLRYRYIADNKWALECLRRAGSVLHGGTLSKYLVGGLSERFYLRFWREKVRFTAEEMGVPRSLPVVAVDVAKAVRFLGGRWLRSWRRNA
ncbi:MAG: glycosyltransferase [Rubrivivax sp.]|nr:glycosyltransferase [Rubrivivax sp.]